MNINEFSKRSGLSQHTLRYYEKIGLLPDIARNGSNHRQYSERDMVWVAFIKRLKETNMPLADIQRYAVLREQGAGTEPERRQLLREHAQKLEDTIRREQEHLNRLNEKIQFYEKCRDNKQSA